MTSVDFHVHVLQQDVMEVATGHTVLTGFGVRDTDPSPAEIVQRRHHEMLHLDAMIEGLDRRGTDLAVISSALVVQNTSWADRSVDRWAHRKVNDRIASLVADAPDRLVGSFTLPLRNRADTEREFDRAVRELDLRVVNLPAQVEDAYLGEASLRWLWDLIDASGVIAFLHPEGVRDPWFQPYGLWNSIGQPIEEAKMLSSLIYGGVLESMRDPSIVVAHGGGYLPHYMGRHDRNWENMPESAVNISRMPSSYLRDLYFDTAVYDPGVVHALASRVGADRLVMGSDAPFGDGDPLGTLAQSGLSPSEQLAIAGENALALLDRASALP